MLEMVGGWEFLPPVIRKRSWVGKVVLPLTETCSYFFPSTSYTTQYKKRMVKASHHGQIHMPLCRYSKYPRKDMRGKTQDGSASCWFKVTVSVLLRSA